MSTSNIHQNSRIAHESIKHTKLRSVEKIARFCINYNQPISRQEIAKKMNIGINVVCGRINDIMKDGINIDGQQYQFRSCGNRRNTDTRRLNEYFEIL